jgi:hypothetical protein
MGIKINLLNIMEIIELMILLILLKKILEEIFLLRKLRKEN